MKKIKKGYNSKIIVLITASIFLLNNVVDGIDLSNNKACLRVKLIGNTPDGQERLKVIMEDIAETYEVNQDTVTKEIELTGKGLHSNKDVKIILKPAKANTGIVFVKKTKDGTEERVKCSVESLQPAQKRTLLKENNIEITTPEHLLSACYAFGIHDLEVELQGDELPVFDGSSKAFVEALFSVGHNCKENKHIEELSIKKPIFLSVLDNDKRKLLITLPYSSFKTSYFISREPSIIGKQSFSFDFATDDYVSDVSKARTFAFSEDLKNLKSQEEGFLGADHNNMWIIDRSSLENKSDLTFSNEFARHKVLDMIGDFAVFGKKIKGHFIAIETGHRHNAELAKLVLKQEEVNYSHKELDDVYSQLYDFLKSDSISFDVFLEIVLSIADSYPGWNIGRIFKVLDKEWENNKDQLLLFEKIAKKADVVFSYSGTGGIGKGTIWDLMSGRLHSFLKKYLLYASRDRRYKKIDPNSTKYKELKEFKESIKSDKQKLNKTSLSVMSPGVKDFLNPLFDESIYGRKIELNELLDITKEGAKVYTEFDGVHYLFCTEGELKNNAEKRNIATAQVSGYLQGISLENKNDIQNQNLNILEAGIPILLAAKKHSNTSYYSFFVMPMSRNEFREKTQKISLEELVNNLLNIFNNNDFQDEKIDRGELLRIIRKMRNRAALLIFQNNRDRDYNYTQGDISELINQIVFQKYNLSPEEMKEIENFRDSSGINKEISDQYIAAVFNLSYVIFGELTKRLKHRENVAGKPFKFETNDKDLYKTRISNGVEEVAFAVLNKNNLFNEFIINSWEEDYVPRKATKRFIFSIAMYVLNKIGQQQIEELLKDDKFFPEVNKKDSISSDVSPRHSVGNIESTTRTMRAL